MNFWNVKLLLHGVELAKKTQRGIYNQGTALLQEKKIKMTRLYRYVQIDKNELKDTVFFMYPQALTRLGLFIIEAYKKQNHEDKPIIIGIKNSEKHKYLVVGVSGHERPFAEEGKNENAFGVIF